ncbi:MAG: patatin-like phospholipase family protein [Caulobacteraceae bacterium]|nr:patatin-like phospholipase family protein [Caulobacteraceae bacterium]
MSSEARSALVLQGGGALGAYEFGAVRRLYEEPGFAPDLIAGVSIGAITAALLARPAKGLTPIQALSRFWEAVTVSGWFLPPPLRAYASAFGNPRFFTPRTDLFNLASWTNLYDTTPLRRTLAELVDLEALADPEVRPGLLVSATDVAAGEITYFRGRDGGMGLDHILASGSLPPSFPMTWIGEKAYWDGGLFDNTPLGPVLDDLAPDGGERIVYVLNLFPNAAPIPATLAEVSERTLNLQFANRTREDLALMRRFDQVAALVDRLEALGDANPLADTAEFKALLDRRYVRAPQVVEITRPEQAGAFDGMDFSPAGIMARADEGYAQADAALKRRASPRPTRAKAA